MDAKVLDFAQKPEVSYCIPLWLRDEQIKQALTRTDVGRIAPAHESRSEACAVVGFGPSLKETWEQIKQFPVVFSCSGSHKFLVDKGIIPTYHVEVDPREHKVGLIGPPQRDTTYLISSTCHPKVFDHLKGYNVHLWHVFDPSEEGLRQLPPGEWAVTGGCDVGMRTMSLAAFLGYRDLHIFGLDGSTPIGIAERHAAEHPHGVQKYCTTEYKGVTYHTTPAMLAAAQQTLYELNQLPKVNATFYGEGLIQEMMKDYTREPAKPASHLQNIVGFQKPELISAGYRNLNSQLHQDNLAYGVGGGKYRDTVCRLAEVLKTQSVLDYGCGKGYLAKAMPYPIWEYDPAILGKDAAPRPADLVICTDVLEHIEPEKLPYVLSDLKRCTKKMGYLVIHTGPAGKTLADGRNAHLIQKGKDWWFSKLKKHFSVSKIFDTPPLLHVLVTPRD